MSWALVAGAVGVAALSVTVWLKVRPRASRAVDAGPGSGLATLATGGGDATTTATHAEPPLVRMEAPVVTAAAPPPAPPSPASLAASAAPPTAPSPPHHVSPPFASRHAPAADAGAPAPNCNPPWFLDSAGHKQYKPECF
jgi:hypothetical protein